MNKTFIRPSKPRVVTRSNVSSVKKYNVRRNLHAVNNDLLTTSYFVGKTITLFTFFYTSLNWLMYKNINQGNNDQDQDQGDDKDTEM